MWVMKGNLWDRLMCFSNSWHVVQFMDKATSHSHIVATFVSQVPFFLSFVSRNDIFNPATMHQTGTHGQGESWCLSPGPVNRAQWLMATAWQLPGNEPHEMLHMRWSREAVWAMNSEHHEEQREKRKERKEGKEKGTERERRKVWTHFKRKVQFNWLESDEGVSFYNTDQYNEF